MASPPEPHIVKVAAQTFLKIMRVPTAVKCEGAAAVAAWLHENDPASADVPRADLQGEAVCFHMEAMRMFDVMHEMLGMVQAEGGGLPTLLELWRENMACRLSQSE